LELKEAYDTIIGYKNVEFSDDDDETELEDMREAWWKS